MSSNNISQTELNQENQEKKIDFSITCPNFTQIPNILCDEWLPYLKEIELKVLLVIYRKTFGWQKRKDQISLSQLQNLTGLSRDKVCDAVNFLIEKGIIRKELSGDLGTQTTTYEAIVNENKTIKEGGAGCALGGSSKKLLGGSSNLLPTKERDINKYKEINKEKNASKDAVVSDDTTFVFNFFENKFNENRKAVDLKPIKLKNTKAQMLALESLVKKKGKDKVLQVIQYALEDNFWSDKLETPILLNKKFNTLEMQMLNKKVSSVANTEVNNRIKCQDFYEKYKNSIKGVRLDLLSNSLEFVYLASSAQPIIINFKSRDINRDFDIVKRKFNLI